MKHLLSIDDLDRDRARASCSTCPSTSSRSPQRDIPKVPALRGKVVVVALLRGLDPHPPLVRDRGQAPLLRRHDLHASASSSVKKGESLRDTVQTIEAMGIDAIVVRHPARGRAAPGRRLDRRQRRQRRRRLPRAPDPGAARRAHAAPPPRRDARRAAGSRSSATSATRGSPAATCWRSPRSAPRSRSSRRRRCCPSRSRAGRCRCSHDLDDVLPEVDVVYLLRIQLERQRRGAVPDRCASTPRRYGLTVERAAAAASPTRSSCTRAR